MRVLNRKLKYGDVYIYITFYGHYHITTQYTSEACVEKYIHLEPQVPELQFR